MTPGHRRLLDERGWVALEGFLPPERRRRLVDRIEALFAAEGDRAGAEFRRARPIPGPRIQERCS